MFQVKNIHVEKRTEAFSQLQCYTLKEKAYRHVFWNIQVLLFVTFREKKKNRGTNMAEEPDITSKQRQNI